MSESAEQQRKNREAPEPPPLSSSAPATSPLPAEEDAAATVAPPNAPSPPTPIVPNQPLDRVKLRANVCAALNALLSYFQSSLTVSGVLATDLFTFNSSLGATIEQQVVAQLNQHRELWDPSNIWPQYRFERQAQRFPDVILATTAEKFESPILGIELKGWYLLAKERDPSFRYLASPNVCSEFDLLVIYPWALSEVISGSPILFEPYIIGARFAAQYRNWHWEHVRQSKSDKTIKLSEVNHYYPSKNEKIIDEPKNDRGKNFGRLARAGILESYKNKLFSQQLSGIPLDAWQRFFKIFAEGKSEEAVNRFLENLASDTAKKRRAEVQRKSEALKDILEDLKDILIDLTEFFTVD